MADAESLLAKLNVYDQLGLLAVGGLLMLVVWFDAAIFGIPATAIPCPESFAAKLLIAYFLGHLVQAIANVLVGEDKSSFSEPHLAVLKAAARQLRMKEFDADRTFQLCYMLALANDATGQVNAFNATYSLCRGWFVILAMNAAFFSIVSAMTYYSFPYVAAALASVTAAALIGQRAARYYRYLRSKALQSFQLFSKKK